MNLFENWQAHCPWQFVITPLPVGKDMQVVCIGIGIITGCGGGGGCIVAIAAPILISAADLAA
jgi:hypothetical protein